MASALIRLRGRPRQGPPWHQQPFSSSSAVTNGRSRTKSPFNSSSPKAPPQLRDYQRALLLEARRRLIAGPSTTTTPTRRLLVPVATGLGKTVIFANLPRYLQPTLADAADGTPLPPPPPPRALVLVHRDELVRQAADAFVRWGTGTVRVGVEKGRERVADPGQVDIVVASVQSLGRPASCAKRLAPYLRSWLGPPTSSKQPPRDVLLVVDEAHHITPGSTYDSVLSAFGLGSGAAAALKQQQQQQLGGGHGHEKKGPRTFLLGFTATPFRHDGVSLAHAFDGHLTVPALPSEEAEEEEGEEGEQLDLAWGIREGYLCDILAYRVQTVVTLDGLRVRMRDYARTALGRAVNREDRNAAIVKAFVEHGGRQAIAFCADVAHAAALARSFEAQGIAAAAIHGAMDVGERRAALARFREGGLRVLTNYGVLTEGFDASGCDTVLMARPTLSRGLYLQMLGRAARPDVALPTDTSTTAADRRALIRQSSKPHMRVIDVVDNLTRHSGAAAAVTLPSLLALPPAFDMGGASLDGVLRELKTLVQEARALRLPCPESLFEARSLDDLRLRVQRFRLLGARALEEEEEEMVSDIPAELLELQRARAKAKREARKRAASQAAPQYPPLAVPGELRPGDRIGMGGGGSKGEGGDPVRYATHVVKVVALLRPPSKRGGLGGGGGGRVKVAMVDGAGGRFAWETARVKDDEKEPLHVGSHYLLSGVVKLNDLSSPPSSNNNNSRGEVWVERAALHNLGRDAEALVRAHRQALWRQSQDGTCGAAAGAAWDAALRAHFAGRGGGRGKGLKVVGARLAPVSRQRREEDGEAQQRAGLLVAPHHCLPGQGAGGGGRTSR